MVAHSLAVYIFLAVYILLLGGGHGDGHAAATNAPNAAKKRQSTTIPLRWKQFTVEI
jgi:hypothetical protein